MDVYHFEVVVTTRNTVYMAIRASSHEEAEKMALKRAEGFDWSADDNGGGLSFSISVKDNPHILPEYADRADND